MNHTSEQTEFYNQLRLSRNKLATRALCHISALNQELRTAQQYKTFYETAMAAGLQIQAQRDELLAALKEVKQYVDDNYHVDDSGTAIFDRAYLAIAKCEQK